MQTLLITQADVREILDEFGRGEIMMRVIDRLRDGLRRVHTGETALSAARGAVERDGGVIDWAPHREPGRTVTVRTAASSPDNPREHALPTGLGTLARVDDRTGRLLAIADGVQLTAIRTGAASAVAASALARRDSHVVGMVGTGAQAVTQLHALSLLFPIETVLAWDVDASHLASFARRVAFLGVRVQPATPSHIVERADIVTTATSVGVGDGPVVPDGDHRPHLHVNAVGADQAGRAELPLPLLRRALVIADDPERALRDGESRRLTADALGPSLGHVCADPSIVDGARDRLTVFDSTGSALQDHLTLDVFLEAAEKLAIGTHVAIEHHPIDPLDPYARHASDVELPGGDLGKLIAFRKAA